jgi:hypothetical protein
MILAQRRPVQDRVPGRVISNGCEFGEVRLTCQGGYEYGAKDRDAGNNCHQGQELDGLCSRDLSFFFPFARWLTNRTYAQNVML